MESAGIKHLKIKKIALATQQEEMDVLAMEEPLEIRISFFENGERITKSVSITMRTPGQDANLALGFLFTEGIIKSKNEVAAINQSNTYNDHWVEIDLHQAVKPSIKSLERNFYTTSSCGVCGKASLDSIRVNSPFANEEDNLEIPIDLIYKLPEQLINHQQLFAQTGGLHASALFNEEGELLLVQEDVGRHNALDKVIGAMMLKDKLPLRNHVLLLSGRISFELVQKAFMAGIKIIAAVGAPSSLAVQMAEENKMTLIGFLKGKKCNVYTGGDRIII
jgi:FdhD protein